MQKELRNTCLSHPAMLSLPLVVLALLPSDPPLATQGAQKRLSHGISIKCKSSDITQTVRIYSESPLPVTPTTPVLSRLNKMK